MAARPRFLAVPAGEAEGLCVFHRDVHLRGGAEEGTPFLED
ncbi:hypothetical protein SAMN02745194_03595 [Roseomonas rosea]|uniref:Uncharacterized protein n=1 Tax=Muricoccus roseus TaxID=198092 RepID=A0A1M6MUZ7_9PROT|nr:hypothetical protein [Roseomonas rosea]SHJ87113.1 hypothetical protein SAMN02745194_03595 [Roseomonas rosea]